MSLSESDVMWNGGVDDDPPADQENTELKRILSYHEI
jgi:hypothetical protein